MTEPRRLAAPLGGELFEPSLDMLDDKRRVGGWAGERVDALMRCRLLKVQECLLRTRGVQARDSWNDFKNGLSGKRGGRKVYVVDLLT